ncbi:MAG: hypothetical protein H7296_11750, partial [Bacteroidia bacterium]|nr:hypothetical protein [Bacteroidia bacterium]
QATMYNYDIGGNVTKGLRKISSLENLDQDIKIIDYDFDVISGKVNAVYYQKDEPDQYKIQSFQWPAVLCTLICFF